MRRELIGRFPVQSRKRGGAAQDFAKTSELIDHTSIPLFTAEDGGRDGRAVIALGPVVVEVVLVGAGGAGEAGGFGEAAEGVVLEVLGACAGVAGDAGEAAAVGEDVAGPVEGLAE